MPSGSRRTFDREIVSVVRVELQQRADDQAVDRHPDRAAPVRVAAEHARVGLGRQVADVVSLIAHVEHERMVGVVPRERSNPMRAEKFVFVEHLREHPPKLVFVEDGGELPAGIAFAERVVNVRPQFRTLFEEPGESSFGLGVLPRAVRLEHGRRAQRQQSDHRTHFQTVR